MADNNNSKRSRGQWGLQGGHSLRCRQPRRRSTPGSQNRGPSVWGRPGKKKLISIISEKSWLKKIKKCCESYSRFFSIVKFPDKSEFQNLGKTIFWKRIRWFKGSAKKVETEEERSAATAKTSSRFESLRGLKGSPGCRRSASWSPRSGSSSQTNLCTPWSGTWKMK